ncbi:hypothetical protein CC80DRAFT_499016 [Byssothecium circinans]|uniref:Uncharacterized protein n=1 Tax=Byssothecium circinans TaxID=147558 RepID=A0A6A5UIE1_9PLEO|nr:hypothetical protein CC80DRAFT_499016 [Byssothecium circinans]
MYPHSPKTLKRKRTPFIASPSRIIRQSLSQAPLTSPPTQPHISTCPPSTHTVTNPLTTLLLSLPLAQNIHNLLLTSREIENLCRSQFTDLDNEGVAASLERRRSDLEERYDHLREDVECELESAWVGAGFLPAAIPSLKSTFNVSSKREPEPLPATGIFACAVSAPGKAEVYYHTHGYSVDRELRMERLSREQEERQQQEKRQRGTKRVKRGGDVEKGYYGDAVYTYSRYGEYYEYEDDDAEEQREEEGETFEMVMPIEHVALVPLSGSEKQRLRRFTFGGEKGKGKGNGNGKGKKDRKRDVIDMRECVSPRGSVFMF